MRTFEDAAVPKTHMAVMVVVILTEGNKRRSRFLNHATTHPDAR